jgi:acyl transferase domain-containing protein
MLTPEMRREILREVSEKRLTPGDALARLGTAAASPEGAERAGPAPHPPGADRAHLLQLTGDFLEAIFVRKLNPAAKFDRASTFERLGVNSINVLELVRLLEGTFGTLPKTLLFEHNSLAKLAGYFVERHGETLVRALGMNGAALATDGARLFGAVAGSPARTGAEQEARASDAPGPRATGADDGIAIVGLGLRFPGARTADELWRNLSGGVASITEIPAERWDHRLYPGTAGSAQEAPRWGGFLTDIDKFDAAFFGISPHEAEQMDPQERLFLEVAWETLEDAGYTRERLARPRPHGADSDVGVFVGMMYGAYQIYGSDQIEENTQGPNSAYWSVANRVSYFFNFQGPSLAVDTACSASLTALHLACESLRRGECKAALAGGVTLMVHPRQFLALTSMKMLSRDDRCRAFGEGADGFVPAEGVGSVLLRPLGDAIASGDRIYGVIKGSSINAGGKTSGYTVPNPVSQGNAIAAALRRAGVDPQTVSCIEAHGTGTSLGDPIEIRGLARAFGPASERAAFCALGSVKTNLGHLQAAAGMAGLAKVLLQLRHRQFAPTLNADSANPHIDFSHSPFYLVRSLQPWERPTLEKGGRAVQMPRRAGISSFGVGGANAHLVVEEWDGGPGAPGSRGPEAHLIPLSARSADALRRQASRLKAWLEAQPESGFGLGDLAFSLQTGREAMEHRMVLIAADRGQVLDGLRDFLEGRAGPALFASRETDAGSPALGALGGLLSGTGVVRDLMARGQSSKLAALWASGLDLEWALLHAGLLPRRISLPTYPFAQRSFWAKPPAATAARLAGAGVPPGSPTLPGGSEAPAAALDASELRSLIVLQLAAALKMAPGDVEVDRPLNDFGVNSLVGASLSKALGKRLGIDISATLLWEYPTIRALSDHLASRKLRASPAPPGDRGEPQERDPVHDRIGRLSEAEVDALLGRLLPEPGAGAAAGDGRVGGNGHGAGPGGAPPTADSAGLLARLRDGSPEAAFDYFNRIFNPK